MKKISVLSIFLIFWTIQILSSERNNKTEESYIAFLREKIKARNDQEKLAQEHRLTEITRTQKAYQEIQKRYGILSKEKKEAYFDTLIARKEDLCCECCQVFLHSKYFPVLASSATFIAYSALNICLICPAGNKKPSTTEENTLATNIVGCMTGFLLTGVLCAEICKELHEFEMYRKTHPATILPMHTIPTLSSNRDKMV